MAFDHGLSYLGRLGVTSGVSPCDANGDIYWATTGDLDRVYIQIYGYWI